MRGLPLMAAAYTKGCGIRPGGYGPEEDVNKRVARMVRRQVKGRKGQRVRSATPWLPTGNQPRPEFWDLGHGRRSRRVLPTGE